MNSTTLKENPGTHKPMPETVFIWEELAESGIKRGGNKPLHLEDRLTPVQKHPVPKPVTPQCICYSLLRCFPLPQQLWSI